MNKLPPAENHIQKILDKHGSYVVQQDDIAFFREKLRKTKDPIARIRYENAIKALEDTVVIYRLRRSETPYAY